MSHDGTLGEGRPAPPGRGGTRWPRHGRPSRSSSRTSTPRLFGALCLVTGDRDEAEEIMQDAFLRLWERWDASFGWMIRRLPVQDGDERVPEPVPAYRARLRKTARHRPERRRLRGRRRSRRWSCGRSARSPPISGPPSPDRATSALVRGGRSDARHASRDRSSTRDAGPRRDPSEEQVRPDDRRATALRACCRAVRPARRRARATRRPPRPQAPEPAHRGGCRRDRGLRGGDLDRDERPAVRSLRDLGGPWRGGYRTGRDRTGGDRTERGFAR